MLDTAESFAEISTRSRKKVPALQGRIVFNLFFENSTRTRTSFSLAAKRLSADTQDFSAERIEPIERRVVHRYRQEHRGHGGRRHGGPPSHAGHAAHLLAQHLKCSIINAGDGAHEHPTQALLDMMTIRRAKGRIDGLTVGLLGRYLPLAGGAVQYLGADQAGRQGHLVRAADPRSQGVGANRLRGRLPSRRGLAAVRRRQRAANPVRAPAGGVVSVGRRVFALLHDDARSGCAWPRTTFCSWPPGRSTGAWS